MTDVFNHGFEDGTLGPVSTAISGGSITVVQSPAHPVAHGTRSARFYIERPADLNVEADRAEVTFQGIASSFEYEQEYWVAFNYYLYNWGFDTDAEGTPIQFHIRPSNWQGCGGHLSAMGVAPWLIANDSGVTRFASLGVDLATWPTKVNQWINVVVNFRISKTNNSTTGFIKFWLNGVQLVNRIGRNHILDPDFCNAPWRTPYAKMGIYKWNWKLGRPRTMVDSRTCYLDDIRFFSGANTFANMYNPVDTAPVDTTPPVISNVQTANITNNSCTITWTTNEPATSIVEYGLSTSYGTNSTDTGLVTSHSVNITALTTNTLYNFRVRSADAAGNMANGSNTTFTTLNLSDTVPPVISNLITSATATSITATWDTNENATRRLRVLTPTIADPSIFNPSLVTSGGVTKLDLSPNTDYICKISCVDAFGNATEQTLPTIRTLNNAIPIISNIQVLKKKSKARITWTTNVATTGKVIYGVTALYGTESSLTASGTSHSVTISTLIPGTIYQFKVSVTDSNALVAESANASFITDAAIAISDDFNAGTFDDLLWTEVDPTNSLTFSQSGGNLSLSIPSGMVLDAWTTNKNAPYLYQEINNSGFTAILKVNILPTANNQAIGMLFLQDANNFQRFELLYNASAFRIYFASVTGATANQRFNVVVTSPTAPMWLKMVKTVNQTTGAHNWTGSYSYDGINYTQAGSSSPPVMTITGMGIHVLTSGTTPPGFSTTVDSFTADAPPVDPPVDTIPPVISNISYQDINPNEITITFITSENATSKFEYGLTNSYGFIVNNTVPTTSHNIRLVGLSEDTEYFFRITCTDAANNVSIPYVDSFVTENIPALPLTIFNPQVIQTAIGTYVRFTWETDRPATSQVDYFNENGNGIAVGEDYVTEHAVDVFGIIPGEGYNYVLSSYAEDGGTAITNAYKFYFGDNHPTPDIIKPIMLNIEVKNLTSSSAKIFWFTNELTVGRVVYGTTVEYGSEIAQGIEYLTEHETDLTGLTANTGYHFRIYFEDKSGNKASSINVSFTTLV